MVPDTKGYKYFSQELNLNVMFSKISGGYSCGEIPVPIPNTEVKSTASRILGWRRPGKVDTARFN